jgi:hypothetical protein
LSLEQLKTLSREAFKREDYETLRKIRLKILEYNRDHPSPSPSKKDFSLEARAHVQKEKDIYTMILIDAKIHEYEKSHQN